MSDQLIFASGDTPQRASIDPWKIIIVDDEPDVHEVTRLALRGFEFDGQPLAFYSAYSAAEAAELLRAHPESAIVLLDVVMESERAGLDFVRVIREDLGNDQVRIILRTGQPGQAPEDSVIRDYDINDYKEKTEFTSQRLFTSIYAALRSFRDITRLKAMSAKLEQSRAAIETAARAKAAFVSAASHELRPPLDTIVAASDILTREAYGPLGDARYKQYAWDIDASGKSLRDMVENILEFVDDSSGVARLEESEFDLADCVTECLSRLEGGGPRGLRLRSEPGRRLRIRADRHAVQRMVLALASNALKFGASRDRFGMRAARLPDGRIQVSVLDDGPGMSDEQIRNLTKPFAEHESGHLATGKGLGIGLAVTKLLIERHGGELWLERRPEGGTAASLVFPRARSLAGSPP